MVEEIKRPKWLTVEAAAQEIGVSPRTMDRLLDENLMIWAKFRGCKRVFAKSVDHYAMATAAKIMRDSGAEIPAALRNEIEDM